MTGTEAADQRREQRHDRTPGSGGPGRPAYGPGGLAGVLPAVAASLGGPAPLSRMSAPAPTDVGALELPPARGALVVLVDGLGYELLVRRGGHAPYLRSLLGEARRLDAGFPSTTATSMGTFGTGLPPGAHGLVGYDVLVPEEDRVFNELSWRDGPVPEDWQPSATVFERLVAAGVPATMIGPGYFDASGLTRSALRGARFRAADKPDERVPAALAALRENPRQLVYLYWGEVDRTGHERGCASLEWGLALEEADAALRQLAGSLPAGVALHITADHGMVDVPFASRIDLSAEPELDRGVRHLGGEPRAPMLYVEPGAVLDVAAAWRARLGPDAYVRTREQVLDEGWFGPVTDRVSARIGDIVIACLGQVAVVDPRRHGRTLLSLLGVHGSVTPEEMTVPLLSVAPREGTRRRR